MTSKGIIPATQDLELHPEKSIEARAWLIGRVAALINDILPAQQIVDDMVAEAAKILQQNASQVVTMKSKL